MSQSLIHQVNDSYHPPCPSPARLHIPPRSQSLIHQVNGSYTTLFKNKEYGYLQMHFL